MFIFTFLQWRSSTRDTDNPVLADVTGVLCCVGGATGKEGVLAKYFARRGQAASGSRLEAVLAYLKATGQPPEAARGLMQVVELSTEDN